MTQVNMLKAKTELSKLVHLLETNQEDVIYIARNGDPIVEMRLMPKQVNKRIGIAKGKFEVPAEFDDWDSEVAEMFVVTK